MITGNKIKYLLLHEGSSPDHCDEGRHFRWSGPSRLNPELHWYEHDWSVTYPEQVIFPWVSEEIVSHGRAG